MVEVTEVQLTLYLGAVVKVVQYYWTELNVTDEQNHNLFAYSDLWSGN
jgi:hypothetical protein